MTLLVVNFHYVRAEAPERSRAIFPVSVERLVAQVELLGRLFDFVDRDAVEAAVAGSRPLPERACLLTFDDGLREQAELALPALLRLGVVPLFLIPGRPLAEGRALYVHKVHHIRDVLERSELLALLEAPLARLGRSLDDVTVERASSAYSYDEPEEARVKFLLNHVVPLEERERVVDEIFGGLVESERTFCDQLYMPSQLVDELERKHHAVGAHSYSHRPLALLSQHEVRKDLERSAATLERFTGVRPRTLSYPHGSLEAVDRAVALAAAEAGFRVGFTMERAFNRTLDDPLLLARVDTNDAPGGARPLFSAGPGGRLETVARMTEGRTRYGDEPVSAGAA